MTRRLLAVSWEMPPMYGPRATQVSRALRALTPLGWETTVITMAPRAGGPHWRDAIEAAPLAGVDLVRVPSPEEWWLVRAGWRIAPVLRGWPDPQWVWIKRASTAAVREAALRPYAGLVTFGQPWSDHLIGLDVSRRTGLPWVAHFSDPWVDSPYAPGAPWQRASWRRMEADVIGRAAAVVFVTSETADLVMKKYPPEWRRKASVVPHGYEEAAPVPRARRSGPLRVVHTGRFYSGMRTPLPVFEAIAALNVRTPLLGSLELTLVGPHVAEFTRQATAMGLRGIVLFRDRVAPADAAAIAADADVLLVIDAPSAGPSVFLPSKLIDYLPLRKPILGITPETGASATLLRRLGCRMAPPERVDLIAEALGRLIDDLREGRLAVAANFDCVAADYDIRRTAAQLSGVLVRAFDQ